MEGDGDNRAQPGATREPEQEWVREWIPDQRLESDARDTKRAAHQKSEQRTRQPELPDDRRGQQVAKRHVGGPEQQRRRERRKDRRREQDVPHRAVSRRSEEHTSELQSRLHLVCRLLLEKKKDAIATAAQLQLVPLRCTPADSPATVDSTS